MMDRIGEMDGNHFQFNPWGGWDHHHHHLPPPPPPPAPPPPNFRWPGDGIHHYHNNHRRDFHHDSDFHDPQFHHFKSSTTMTHTLTSIGRGSQIQYVFELEGHGSVVEIVVLDDKRTGQHQEYCFVKYASTEEADKAISALHDQFIFPGVLTPVKVKYADGEMVHLANKAVHRVYVDGLNKEATELEVIEIFSSYGDVADVYIMRDKQKQWRGSVIGGFVGFTHKYMAVAAIYGLNGTYVTKDLNRDS